MDYFILKDNEHLGPYGADVIVRFLKQGKISKNQLLWREGLSKPRRFDDLFKPVKKKHLKKEIPTVSQKKVTTNTLAVKLPPLPIEAQIPNIDNIPSVRRYKKKVQPKRAIHIETYTPSLKDQVIDKTKEFGKWSYPLIVEFARTSKDITLHLKELKISHKRLKQVSVFMVLLVVVAFGIKFIPKGVDLDRPAKMSLTDFNRLKKIVGLPTLKTQLGYVLSKDKKTLWVATNLKGSGEVTAKFKSIKNRSLGQAVEFYSTGQLSNHLVEFKKFKFNKGARLFDALYEIEIKSTKPLSLSYWDKMKGENSIVMNYVGKGLVSSYNATQFKTLLGKMIQQKRKNTKDFWLEIGEKYKTVKMITSQIQDGIDDIFNKNKDQWEMGIINFENQYRQSWGQFFTAFVKANDKSYAKYAKKKFEDKAEVLAYYNNLSNLAIQIGENSMATLEVLQGLNLEKVTSEMWDEIHEKAIQEFKKIQDQCDENMKKIEQLTE